MESRDRDGDGDRDSSSLPYPDREGLQNPDAPIGCLHPLACVLARVHKRVKEATYKNKLFSIPKYLP